MYKVTLPIDFSGARYGIAFMRSVGKTDDDRIAAMMRRKGFQVEPEEPKEFVEPVEPEEPGKSVSDMTLEELKAYAAARGVDLAGKTKKADILAAVLAWAGNWPGSAQV